MISKTRKFILGCLASALVTQGLATEKELCFSFDDGNVSPVEKTGEAEWVSEGKCGGAYKFDGQKDLLKLNSSEGQYFAPGESFTVELWVKPLAADEKKLQTIISKTDPATKNRWQFHMYTNGRLGFSSGNKETLNINMLSPVDARGDWHHLAFVRDCGENMVRFYLDNKLVVEKNIPGNSEEQFNIDAPLVIGGLNQDTRMFEGLVDEIKFTKGVKKFTECPEAAQEYKPAPAVTETPDKDIASSWDQIDKYALTIVPCPKKFEASGKLIPLTGKWDFIAKSAGLQPGIDVINDKLKDASIEPLSVVKTSSSNRIVAGNYDDMAEYLAKIGNPQKPPRQGYVIDFYDDGPSTVCVIAGADADGTRYGCVTLSEMIKTGKTTELVQAKVTDWPDYKYRRGFSIHDTSLERLKNTIDTAFKAKFNMISGDGFYSFPEIMLKTAEQRKKVYNYAAERGIKIIIGGNMDVGPAPMPRNMNQYSQYYYPYKSNEGLIGHKGMAFTWSRDDLIKAKADLVAEFMHKTGASTMFFHAMDTGGRYNPENWASRTPMDIKRWGNDRAGADANLITLMYSRVKEENPEALFMAIVYPYGAEYLQYPDISEWLKKLSASIPEDIFICVREGMREDMKKWKDAIRQQRFIYHEPHPCSFGLMFTPTARYAATFFFDDRDFYFFCLGAKYQWPTILSAAEYSWNTKAPGWAWMQADYRTVPGTDSFPSELTERLLPRITSILYGPKAAANMADIYKQNLSYTIAGDLHQFSGTDQEAYFKAKYEASIKAVAWLKEAEKNISPEYAEAFSATKVCVKYARGLLEARYRYFLSRRLLAAEKYAEAENEIALAIKATEKLPKEDKYVKAVLTDLDIASAIKWRKERKEYLNSKGQTNISIGLYSLGPSKGIEEGFDGVPGIKIATFDDPKAQTLKNFNVIIFPASMDIGDTTEDWRENVKDFVKNGGGVIFSHNSIGRAAGSAFGKPLFPEICEVCTGQVSGKKSLEIVVEHKSTGDLRKGEKFEHEYNDHLILKPGKNANVIIKDSAGNPVMVAGEVGKGRVIYTGQIFGFNSKDVEKESTGKEWILLYNMVKWAAGK